MNCSDIMYRTAAAIMQSSTDAQDVVADTVEKLWRIQSRLDEVENLQGYIVRAVRNTALDTLRSPAHRKETLDLDSLPALAPDPALTPHQQLERRNELELLRDMMARLPANQRSVLELTAFRGLNNAEVAAATGLTIENVRVLLSRGRSKLRIAYRNFYR